MGLSQDEEGSWQGWNNMPKSLSSSGAPHIQPCGWDRRSVLDSKYSTVAIVVSSTRATVRLQYNGEQITPRNLTGFVFVTSKKAFKDQGDSLMSGWCFSVAWHCTKTWESVRNLIPCSWQRSTAQPFLWLMHSANFVKTRLTLHSSSFL